MRRALVATTVVVLVGLTSPGAPAQSLHRVDIQEDAFVPDRLEVQAGDTVGWVNRDDEPQSITSEDGSFDSGALDPGDGFEIRFENPGTYKYHSAAEADGGNLTGVVVVVPVDDNDGSADPGSGSGSDSEVAAGEPGAAAAPGSDTGSSAGQVTLRQAAAVSIQDDVFVPRRVEVEAGGTVVWQHVGQRPHTVTASDGSFDSGNMESGESFSRAFSQPGTYSYYCRFHGSASGSGMAGVVVVRGGATGEEPPGETDGTIDENGGLAATGSSLLWALAGAVALLATGAGTLAAAARTRRQPR
ncbi:MAG: cupredoxin domain-containing protein [Actinomycetota bacterium]